MTPSTRTRTLLSGAFSLLAISCADAPAPPSGEGAAGPIVVAPPEGLAQLRAVDPANLVVEITINGERQSSTRVGELETVTAFVPEGDQLTIEVAWFETVGGERLQLAEQSRRVPRLQDGATIALRAEDYESARFDDDGDMLSNLSERIDGTDPFDASSPGAVTEVALTGVEAVPTKLFRLSWRDDPASTSYRVLENVDGASGFVAVSEDIAAGTERFDHRVPLYDRFDARYALEVCSESRCAQSASIGPPDPDELTAAIGYFKASNTDIDDRFGSAVALSDDGGTLAVGARGEASSAIGVNSDEGDDSAADAGAVYVFSRAGTSWSQEAYLKASNSEAGDEFVRVSLSGDGDTLAVGAVGEASNGIGSNGGQGNNAATGAGAVYVFTRRSGAWSQTAYLKASNAEAGDAFGGAVTLSGDGNTLAVGAAFEASESTGINPAGQTNNDAAFAGAVYVYSRAGDSWVQDAYIKASNTGAGDFFGVSISLDRDGSTLAVGAPFEGSGSGDDQSDDSLSDAGAVYVFSRRGGIWEQQAYLKPDPPGRSALFGLSISLSDDGGTLVVGGVTDVVRDELGGFVDESGDIAGGNGAYVFTEAEGSWRLQEVIGTSTGAISASGLLNSALSLAGDGRTLAVGDGSDAGSAVGFGGVPGGGGADEAGAVLVFSRVDETWVRRAYVKASNTEREDRFGRAVHLSGDGETLAVGAPFEDGRATGIDSGAGANNRAMDAGAVYLY